MRFQVASPAYERFLAHFGAGGDWKFYLDVRAMLIHHTDAQLAEYEVRCDWVLERHPSKRWEIRAYAVRNERLIRAGEEMV